MFEYNINSKFFYLALATAIGLNNSLSVANTIAIDKTHRAASVVIVSDANLRKRSSDVATVKASSLNKLVSDREDWLLANSESNAAIATSENDKAEVVEPKLKLVRLAVLSFLFLFATLGIFYPFFLFYRHLLNRNSNSNYFKKDNKSKFLKFADPSNIDSSQRSKFAIRGGRAYNLPPFPLYPHQAKSEIKSTETDRSTSTSSKVKTISNSQGRSTPTATVSKLQIAFTPPARKLRGSLSQISSTTEPNIDDIAELMRKAISVFLIHQQYWTHVSYSSDSLPWEKVQSEFEIISCLERNKCLIKELSFVNRKRPANERNDSNRDDSYSYVVVTLILCTSDNSPLFDKIYTKSQLVKELTKLSQIKNGYLTEFELLWNPQEAEYISNERLLTQYSDLTRLL